MHGSGLAVNESTRSEFNRLSSDPNTLYVKFQINDETFILKGSGKLTSSRETDFLEMQKALDNNQPAFLVARVKSSTAEDKWSLVFFMPDGASVKDRMVYAASTAALRQGLGQGMFSPTVYSCSSKSELTLKDFEGASSSSTDVLSLMTREERLKEDSEVAAHLSMSSVKVSAIVGLPVKTDERAIQCIRDIGQKNKSLNTAVFAMHSDDEVLLLEKSGSYTLDDIASLLPSHEPRYVLHSFQHENPEGEPSHAFIFIYYCPEKIKAKLKMFYSTCKSMVIKNCETVGVEIRKSIEISDGREVSVRTTIDELYPKVEEKKMFSKPGKTGKGGNKFLGAGFNSGK